VLPAFLQTGISHPQPQTWLPIGRCVPMMNSCVEIQKTMCAHCWSTSCALTRTHTHIQENVHSPPPPFYPSYTHSHTDARTQTRARTHAHTHTHTHTPWS
jgi:hypothetical protein